MLCLDNEPEMVFQALQRFCENRTGKVYISPGCPWDNGYIESFNNRLRMECLNCNYWHTLFEPAWSSATSSTSTITGTATRPRATAHRPSTLRRAGAPTPRWPAASTENRPHQPDSMPGWTQYRGLVNRVDCALVFPSDVVNLGGKDHAHSISGVGTARSLCCPQRAIDTVSSPTGSTKRGNAA